MAEKKVARIPNFSPAEKESLMNIVMKYASVLEDKRTNRTSIEEKSEIWKKIESEFNNSTPVLAFRSHDQLKRLYDNKKKDIRKKLAEHKKEIYLTGGGPPPPDIVLNRVDNLLLQVLNEKSVKGFSSEFDSDKYFSQDDSLTITQKENFEPIPKKKKTDIQDTSNNVEDVNIFEFVPTDVTDNGNKAIILESICYNQSTRCPPAVLQKPINSKLIPHRETSEATTSSTIVSTPGNERRKNKIPQSNRRRPVGGLHALTSSDVSEKYNILLDRRLVLIEKQIEQATEAKQFAQEEHEQKIINLKLEEDNLGLQKQEKLLKIELLKTEITYKQSLFNTVTSTI